jgi:fatty acid desaturase
MTGSRGLGACRLDSTTMLTSAATLGTVATVVPAVVVVGSALFAGVGLGLTLVAVLLLPLLLCAAAMVSTFFGAVLMLRRCADASETQPALETRVGPEQQRER